MRAIVITSGKGGVGKTTLTANLGRALCRLGQRVVMMDTDFGLNNLDVVMNMEQRVVYDILDVIENRCRARQALIEDDIYKNLFLMPSAHGYSGARIGSQNLKVVIKSLTPSFDYCLVDCPAGIDSGFHRAVAACDEAVVVTTPHIFAVRDADKVVKLINNYGHKCTLIVNRMRVDLVANGEIPSAERIAATLNLPLTGIIPEDDRINVSGFASKNYMDITAKNLHLGVHSATDTQSGGKGFWSGIRRKLRRIN